MSQTKTKINYDVELDPSLLPDLASKAVDKKTAANQLYQALREQAKRMGFDPDTEVFMTDDYKKYDTIDEGKGEAKRHRHVTASPAGFPTVKTAA